MKRFISSMKATCYGLFANFLQMRLLAELPDAERFVQRPADHDSDDPRAGDLPVVGIL